MAEQFNGIAQCKAVKPFTLPAHLGQLRIYDPIALLEVRGSISIDLLGSERLTGLFSFAWVAQTCRPVADDDDRLMAQLLKLTQLAEDDGMPNGHVIVALV